MSRTESTTHQHTLTHALKTNTPTAHTPTTNTVTKSREAKFTACLGGHLIVHSLFLSPKRSCCPAQRRPFTCQAWPGGCRVLTKLCCPAHSRALHTHAANPVELPACLTLPLEICIQHRETTPALTDTTTPTHTPVQLTAPLQQHMHRAGCGRRNKTCNAAEKGRSSRLRAAHNQYVAPHMQTGGRHTRQSKSYLAQAATAPESGSIAASLGAWNSISTDRQTLPTHKTGQPGCLRCRTTATASAPQLVCEQSPNKTASYTGR